MITKALTTVGIAALVAALTGCASHAVIDPPASTAAVIISPSAGEHSAASQTPDLTVADFQIDSGQTPQAYAYAIADRIDKLINAGAIDGRISSVVLDHLDKSNEEIYGQEFQRYSAMFADALLPAEWASDGQTADVVRQFGVANGNLLSQAYLKGEDLSGIVFAKHVVTDVQSSSQGEHLLDLTIRGQVTLMSGGTTKFPIYTTYDFTLGALVNDSLDTITIERLPYWNLVAVQ